VMRLKERERERERVKETKFFSLKKVIGKLQCYPTKKCKFEVSVVG